KGVAVAPDDLGGVRDVAGVFNEGADALDVDLSGDDLGKDAGHLLHRLKNAQGVGNKGRQNADFQSVFHDEVPALLQNDGAGQRDEKQNDGDKHGVEHGGVNRSAVHVTGQRGKIPVVARLNNKGLAGFGAGNALVVGAGDLGVDGAHPAVCAQNPALKQRGN